MAAMVRPVLPVFNSPLGSNDVADRKVGPRSPRTLAPVGHDVRMTDDDEREAGVLAGLPASRPQRRSRRRNDVAGAPPATPRATSAKRTPAPSAATPEPRAGSPRRLSAPAQPRNTPPQPRPPRRPPEPEPVAGGGLVGTAVQAAGEIAQMGLTAGRQIVRGALSRLPKP
jgi:hypothetical protein